MNTFDSAAATVNLRDFQRATVDHVSARLFGSGPQRRFLVADETGLGKSLVARGVVAQTIDVMLERDDIDRIDIVYVCSSTDLARQNLGRLDCADLLKNGGRVSADRLTLLALAGDDFNRVRPGLSKPVNLIAFTPGTSFSRGRAWGQARERALIVWLLNDMIHLSDAEWRRLTLIFTGNAHQGFGAELDDVGSRLDKIGGANRLIVDDFERRIRQDGSLDEVQELMDLIGRKRSVPAELADQVLTLNGNMRSALASASVDALEPDLVILDEFQKFRHLLNKETGPAAELAHELFAHPDAHVLLLSATPYKPFTLAAESDGPDGDNHYDDLMATLRFLGHGDAGFVEHLTKNLHEFRRRVMTGRDAAALIDEIGTSLRQLMVRTERPVELLESMVNVITHGPGIASADELIEHAQLRRLASMVDAPMPIDYWKSTPYFANHLGDYKLGRLVRDALDDPATSEATRIQLEATVHLTSGDLAAPLAATNTRYRALETDMVDGGAWRLPWLPPSLPYTEPAGAWADPDLVGLTKRLIFSSWNSTPASISTLLSHAAEHRMVRGRTLRPRLQYRMADSRPAAMSTLALFWPHPSLAQVGDSLVSRPDGGAVVSSKLVVDQVAAHLTATIGNQPRRAGAEHRPMWESYLGFNGAIPHDGVSREEAAFALIGVSDPAQFANADHAGITGHVSRAAEVFDAGVDLQTDLSSLAELAAFGPANCAWRALVSVIDDRDDVSDADLWRAAAIIGDGLRSLFNREDFMCLFDDLYGAEGDDRYWRVVLRVCADGNLQAVLDEYLHHLRRNEFSKPFLAPGLDRHGNRLDSESDLLALASLVSRAMSLRGTNYQLFDPSNPAEPLRMGARFAVRYGGRHDTDSSDSDRLPEVREAFNSPFWPFVLASTSVGQEGIDFHWWCHAIVHWNLPASPVDFEQREGRVHRFGGHAVRRNVAEEHGPAARASTLAGSSIWDSLWELAQDRRDKHGDLSPEWVYTGAHSIERHLFPIALSTDEPKLARLERSRALYRLAFGQTRQEDMLRLLDQRLDEDDPPSPDDFRIDLRPDGMRTTST